LDERGPARRQKKVKRIRENVVRWHRKQERGEFVRGGKKSSRKLETGSVGASERILLRKKTQNKRRVLKI